MDEQHLKKLREDRLAREKARIEKLRELNLKKYGKSEPVPTIRPSLSNTSMLKRPVKSETLNSTRNKTHSSNTVKSNVHVNALTKRPISAPAPTSNKLPNKNLPDARRKTIFNSAQSDTKHVTNKPLVQTKFVNTKMTERNFDHHTEIIRVISNNVDVTEECQAIAMNDKKIPTIETETRIVNVSRTDARWNAKRFPTIARKVITSNPDDIPPPRLALIQAHSINNHQSCKTKSSDIKITRKFKREPQPVIVSFGDDEEVIPPTPIIIETVRAPNTDKPKSKQNFRKTMEPPKQPESTSKVNPKRQSVFERLYQPKIVHKKPVDDVQNLKSNPDFLKKVLKDSALISNKRHTVFEQKKTVAAPVRRSISAVHFKRISKNEIANCIHKWSSIGDKLDKVHLKEINEDEPIKEDKFVSAVKSERKKVSFRPPMPLNLNTPKPEEMQERLQNWLKKRGKSIDSYHHLQCFGIHHLSQKLKPLNFEEAKPEQYDDENKENIPLDSDSDNESYEDNMNNKSSDRNNKNNDLDGRNDFNDRNNDKVNKDGYNDRNNDFNDMINDFKDVDKDKWRRASNVTVSDSVDDFNMTQTSMMSATDATNHVDELLLGALNDLTELLREGFDRDQCARWLRAIRDRFPSAPDSAAYWECRAALEESRGDLPTSIQCWEEAIAKGTEHSVAEANLDQLLVKFMQLKISPNGGRRQVDPKLVDVKNIFKSTIIRFAVQQAKLRQTTQTPPKYICTPVRRSGRLSARYSEKRTPLRVCTTVKQAGLFGHSVLFVPNDKLSGTP